MREPEKDTRLRPEPHPSTQTFCWLNQQMSSHLPPASPAVGMPAPSEVVVLEGSCSGRRSCSTGRWLLVW